MLLVVVGDVRMSSILDSGGEGCYVPVSMCVFADVPVHSCGEQIARSMYFIAKRMGPSGSFLVCWSYMSKNIPLHGTFFYFSYFFRTVWKWPESLMDNIAHVRNIIVS